MKSAKRQLGTRGQAAIEFMAVVVVIFFFLLFFLSITILIVTSEYLDYATFMAARTYKSGFSSKEYQQRYAEQIFNTYADKVNGVARNFELRFVKADDNDDQTEGIVTNYTIDMFYLPPVFIQGNIPPSAIRLTSEAHLGRDPAFQDCQDYFNSFAQQFRLGIEGTGLVQQMDDNGC